MYKLIKAYKLGYEEGIKDAYRDSFLYKKKKYKKPNYIEIMSKLYDIGYIEGYNKFINYIFNLR